MEQDLKYRIAFSSLRGINRQLADEILTRVDSEVRYFELSESQLGALFGRKSRLFDTAYRRDLLSRAQSEVEFVEKHNISTLYFRDEAYPSRLNDADDAPLLLYGLGSLDINQSRIVGIVGTRHATPYGLDFVDHLVEDLKQKMADPLVIVSGLAFGIDAAAHRAALRCQLPTIGILAHGLNMIYPSQHRQMASDMVHSAGGLLTEYGSNAAVHKGNFIARNRIVAGMCDCIVVAESAAKGGALITANLASGYNRDVFALPGRTSDRYSAGCNALIAANTAALISSADELIRAMNWHVKDSNPQQRELFPTLTAEEQAVVDYLEQQGEAQLNQLSIALNMNVGRMMSLLIDMEFKGLLLTFPGGKYRLA